MFVPPRIVRLFTVIEFEKLIGVVGLIATALKPEFVIMTVCELFGRAAADQLVDWSQLALAGFVHEFTCAKAGAAENVINNVARDSAHSVCLFQNMLVCIVVRTSHVKMILVAGTIVE
jgi:hypothetical protein